MSEKKVETFRLTDLGLYTDTLEELKTEIMAMVSRISDPKTLELIHRFLVRILRDKKE